MRDTWGVHLYLYAGSIAVDGQTHSFGHGSLSITPPNRALEWSFPEHAPHYYAHLLPGPGAGTVTVPVVYQPIKWLDAAVTDFEYIGGHYLTRPIAAQSRIWALLWRAIDGDGTPNGDATHLPPTVQIVMSVIEQSLPEKIVISELARRAGVSHNHLIALFKKSLGLTVRAYIRKRRCERAAFLLRETSLSITSISREVGLPDLHHFNKTIRSEFGLSPRALREKLVQN